MTTVVHRAALRAIAKAGGVVQVGRALGITHNAVLQWKRVPEAHVKKIEKLSGIPRHELRPDLYAPD